ncbi:MAG TPA: ATP-binding cassette domain-containing protein [Acidimicrobiales bacterium]|nr:ATP-binding cassette domain-containing protein [Acidimicrobiales bacterium]
MHAVSHVAFGLEDGMIHGLIGPNGAGKTTLFDALSGVTRVTSGRVLLHGRDVTRVSVARRARRGIRRTFQRQQTFGWLSVEDNLLVAMEWKGGGGGVAADIVRWPARMRLEAQRRKRVAAVLEMCGIGNQRNAPIGSLSIGESRLVEIGRAIVDDPTVLLLDEPTSGLQDAEVERVGVLINQIVAETSCAVGLVEHDVGFVMGICDEITVLNLGSIIAHGTPHEIQQSTIVMEAYLGV